MYKIKENIHLKRINIQIDKQLKNTKAKQLKYYYIFHESRNLNDIYVCKISYQKNANSNSMMKFLKTLKWIFPIIQVFQ